MGLLKFKEMCGQRGHFTVLNELSERDRIVEGLKFYYYCYKPLESNPTGELQKQYNYSGSRVDVVNYAIYVSETNHIRILAEVKNRGKDRASEVFVLCKLVGRMDYVYFSELRTIKGLAPGQSVILQFFTLIPMPDGHHAKYCGNTFNIESDTGRLPPTIERLDCKFEVKAID